MKGVTAEGHGRLMGVYLTKKRLKCELTMSVNANPRFKWS